MKTTSRIGGGVIIDHDFILKKRLEEHVALVAHQNLEEDAESDPEAEPEGEPPETHELQELGASSCMVDPADTPADFEMGRVRALPLWFELHETARPPVRFWMEETYEIRTVRTRSDYLQPHREAVARAVAFHLRTHSARICELLGWCHVPAIGSISDLVALAVNAQAVVSAEDLRDQLDDKGPVLMSFAILLPSGEVLTPRTILRRASKAKQATLAGVLRLAGQPQIAGESWQDEDWSRFERAQRESRSRRQRSSSKKNNRGL